jgi:hypothetical protein
MFSNSIIQNGVMPAQPHNKIKPQQNTCCNTPNTLVAARQTLALNAQNENLEHNLNRISPPNSLTAGKQKPNLLLALLLSK